MSAENITSALPVGYMLQNYRIERALGRGGFGITYLATENITGRKVVIKENYPRGVATRENSNYGVRAVDADNKEMFDWALGSFVAEARVLTGLRHPHIVQVLTAFEALGTAYYVMDYIGGNSLSKMRPGDITEQRLLDILRPILSALNYIHTLPDMLLHRDIKGDNILITAEGTPVLIDFGAARAVISNKTQTKIGTVGYAPPEQWASGAVRGPWTDLYALGATCYYLLTGQNPPDYHDRMFAAPGSNLLAHRTELQKRFSPELLASIDKAFALRPADRWQSAQEWLNALAPAKAAKAASVPEPETINLPPKSDARKTQEAQEELRKRGVFQKDYNSQLINAAENGFEDRVSLLIAAGADVNTENYCGETALYKAVSMNRPQCVRALIKAPGINVNKACKWGDTPLYWAAENDLTECAKLLLAAGADVNMADDWGNTPLYSAASGGHTECMKLLLAAGADVNAATKDGGTPLSAAAIYRRHECVRVLLATPGINTADHNPLSIAVMANDYSLLQQLINRGRVNVNQADANGGKTPLIWAALLGYTECAKLLLSVPGIDVNNNEKYVTSPLCAALEHGHTECAKLLLAAPGIDVNKKGADGWTPLDYAVENKNEECAKLIRSMGGKKSTMRYLQKGASFIENIFS